MTRCANGCDDGWRSVDARWVEAQAPMPDPPGDDASDAQLDEWQRAVDYAHTRRKSLANTVYPCDRCRPELFARWAAGHLDPDHDSSSCSECRDVRRGRASAGNPSQVRPPLAVGVMSPPARKDLDG